MTNYDSILYFPSLVPCDAVNLKTSVIGKSESGIALKTAREPHTVVIGTSQALGGMCWGPQEGSVGPIHHAEVLSIGMY